MRRIISCVAAGAIVSVLAACSSEADSNSDGKITAEEARAEMADASIKPLPGQYKMTMTFKSAKIPGAPASMIDMMGKSMSQTMEYCLTKEEADKGFQDALSKGQDDNCTIERMDMDGGQVDMAMKCNDPASGPMDIAFTGEVTPTSSDLSMKMKGKLGNQFDADIEMTMQQERLGDCAK
ncbi:DUF3617 domain-containing protein [Erythrobacter sp. SDW2]|uniref:DUF3617 domain-containing protein n=1 Tax=Erythrobacter sp. SDW2 TaxID=2907154 RepID=UPI001F3F4DAD|nr:DUF3617 domain-containing protein [Erythrobacter sp. SDW2]UIP07880.1 DUF3617 domain-containing protein [Erythrobacter sp. SDW2]